MRLRMKEPALKVRLLNQNSGIKEWEESGTTDLQELIGTVTNLKQLINDYLSQLINLEKNCYSKQTSAGETDEEEEIENDSISGFIKDLAFLGEKTKKNEKRRSYYSNKAKKIRK